MRESHARCVRLGMSGTIVITSRVNGVQQVEPVIPGPLPLCCQCHSGIGQWLTGHAY